MNAKKTLDVATSVQRSEMESSFGLRYSRLLDLPYFDPIRGHAVDPMHNLLLGTAKHTFSVWLKLGILNDDKIQIIDSRKSKVNAPSESGRITQSMTHYKSMKSSEWQNWVLYLSLFSLKGIIKKEHYNMWQVFVKACFILINTSISCLLYTSPSPRDRG